MPIVLRADFDAARLRLGARQSEDADQVRRLLALAAIYDGATRAQAAATVAPPRPRKARGVRSNLLGGGERRCVGGRFDGAAAEPAAGAAHKKGYQYRCAGICPCQAEVYASETDQHCKRRPQIRREMQRVGL